MRTSERRAASVAAAAFLATAAVACNAIFGITAGQSAGSGGGASSATTTGGGPTSSSSGTTASSSSGTGGTGGGDAGKPPACDGTDPTVQGQTALWANRAANAAGLGLGLVPGGDVIVAGQFSGSSTVFGSMPLPFGDAGQGDNLFVARYTPTVGSPSAQGKANAFIGPGNVGLGSNTDMWNTLLHVSTDRQARTAIAGNFVGSFTVGSAVVSAAPPKDGGDADQDGFVALLDGQRQPLWAARRLGGPNHDVASAVALDSQGNVVVVGLSLTNDPSLGATMSADFGCGPVMVPSWGGDVAFVTKIKPDGTCAWPSQVFQLDNGFLNNFNPGYGLTVAVDPHDDILFAGGARPATSILGPQGMLGSNDNDVDVFVAKLSAADGAVMWAQTYGGTGDQWATAIASDPCGNIILGGQYNGASAAFDGKTLAGPPGDFDHAFLLRLAVDGAKPHVPAVTTWASSIVDVGYQSVTAIAVNSGSDIAISGNILDATGSTSVDFGKDTTSKDLSLPHPAPMPGNMDGYVARYTATGVVRWARRWGGSNDSVRAFGVGLDDTGHLAVTGYFEAPLDFGGGIKLTSACCDVFTVMFGAP